MSPTKKPPVGVACGTLVPNADYTRNVYILRGRSGYRRRPDSLAHIVRAYCYVGARHDVAGYIPIRDAICSWMHHVQYEVPGGARYPFEGIVLVIIAVAYLYLVIIRHSRSCREVGVCAGAIVINNISGRPSDMPLVSFLVPLSIVKAVVYLGV